MTTAIVGALPSRPARAGDKFRATWTLNASAILPGSLLDADGVAHAIQESLPGLGFYTVSNPSAVPGDKAVVFDVRATAGFTGGNVADAAQALDRLPAFGGGWATALTRLEVLPASGISADELAAGQEAEREAANQAAAAGNWLSRLGGFLEKAGLVVAIAGAVVLFVALKGKSKDWE